MNDWGSLFALKTPIAAKKANEVTGTTRRGAFATTTRRTSTNLTDNDDKITNIVLSPEIINTLATTDMIAISDDVILANEDPDRLGG